MCRLKSRKNINSRTIKAVGSGKTARKALQTDYYWRQDMRGCTRMYDTGPQQHICAYQQQQQQQ